MKPGFNACRSRFDFAGDIFTDPSFCMESNERCLRALAILRF
jgi:hypothetical protein